MMQYLTGGADLTAIALFINRIALGAFFTISGFHKLFNRQRHAVFVASLLLRPRAARTTTLRHIRQRKNCPKGPLINREATLP
jgi:uncharacterized membrane protein YphA (DoxX/SURF4 family)